LAVSEEVKRQLWLAGPLIAGCLMQNLIQMISVMFVGHLGELAGPLINRDTCAPEFTVTALPLHARRHRGKENRSLASLSFEKANETRAMDGSFASNLIYTRNKTHLAANVSFILQSSRSNRPKRKKEDAMDGWITRVCLFAPPPLFFFHVRRSIQSIRKRAFPIDRLLRSRE
jgi:hypothetical protein